MVFTRNQKRNMEDDVEYISHKKLKTDSEENEGSDEDSYEESLASGETEESDDLLNEYGFNSVLRNCIKNIVQPCYNEQGNEKDTYKQFNRYVSDIQSGNFFQIPELNNVKKTCSEEEIKLLNSELERLQQLYKNDVPTLKAILTLENTSDNEKSKLLEKYFALSNADVLSAEYYNNLKYLQTAITKQQEPELVELEAKIRENATIGSDDIKTKILKSNMSFNNKVIAYKRLEIMETYQDTDSSEFAKYKTWMDVLLSIPFGVYNQSKLTEPKEQLKVVRNVLDQRLSFLEKPKDQIINLVAQMFKNPETNINAIGLWGTKGVGKSSIVKSIAEALDRPYRTISLCGEADASVLTGHGFTYIGSCPGRIIDILRETKCMNPIVLIDELDKVSETQHGRDIIGNLIHMTDTTTNNKYNEDRYLAGIDIDLSQVLFIFTYNDPAKVDTILADRLLKIQVDNYSFQEKLEITKTHILPLMLKKYAFTKDDIIFSDTAIESLIKASQSDEGMRTIKGKFDVIISRINTLMMTELNDDIIRLKYKSLYKSMAQKPVLIEYSHIQILLEESISSSQNIRPPPFGMYI